MPILRRMAGRLAFWTGSRSEEHTSELQSLRHLVCRLLLGANDSDTIALLTCLQALHLFCEPTQTRRLPRRPGYFNLLTHFPCFFFLTNRPPTDFPPFPHRTAFPF